MQVIQNILKFLDTQASTPKYLGLLHLIFLGIVVVATIALCILWKKRVINNVKKVVLVTSIILFILGLYKQVVLSFDYSPILSFNYNWNNFPWHFLSTPICIGLFIGLTDGNVNKNFTSYFATFGLLAGLWGFFKPNVFVETIGLNIYSMICYGAFIVMAILLYYTKQVKVEFKTLLKGIPVLFMLVGIAISFNEVSYLLLPEQKISMFSISRHFASDTPVYSILHNRFLESGGAFTWLEYIASVLAYILLVSVFALIPLLAIMCVKKLATTDFEAEYGEPSRKEMSASERKELLDKIDALEKQVANRSNNPFLIHYYQNLRVNFGNNTKGSCGYVALAMILSYYDTVLNDKIIPEHYDKPSKNFYNSPGIRKDYPNEDINKWDFNRYRQYIDEKKNWYLHAKLMELADDRDFVLDKDNENYDFGSNDSSREIILYDYLKNVAKIPAKNCEVTYPYMLLNNKMDRVTNVLYKYLGEINRADRRVYDARTGTMRYIKDDYYLTCLNNVLHCSDSVKKFAIDAIRNQGVPVLLSLADLRDDTQEGVTTLDTMDGHAVVAYAVTDNDELICHFGWPTLLYNFEENNSLYEKENEYTSRVASTYSQNTIYKGAAIINFKNMPHVHTNNYEINIGGKTYYFCPDNTYTTKDGDFVNILDDNWIISLREDYECVLEGYRGTIVTGNGLLIIPEKLDEHKTIIIGYAAFKNQKYISEVRIPKTVSFVGVSAFENCNSLVAARIPKSVKNIGANAFKGCKSLCVIEYEGTVTEWQKLQKGTSWNEKTGSYVVYCSNGKIKKNDNSYDLIFK